MVDNGCSSDVTSRLMIGGRGAVESSGDRANSFVSIYWLDQIDPEFDRDNYMPALEKAWAALKTCVHDDGMMGWVQLPAFNPRETKKEHNIDYGAGAFLLAAEEVARLCA